MNTQSNNISEGRITIDPAICNGKPTIRGKRITVQTVLEFISAGESRTEILRQYPSLTEEDIDACLDFAVSLMSHNFGMAMYLIDVNLPYYFSPWRGPEYLHLRDVNDEWTDTQVWDINVFEDHIEGID